MQFVDRKQFTIDIQGNNRKFLFEASSESECLEWVDVIEQNIKASDGFKKAKNAPMTKEFWRQEQLTEEQFYDLADTFDILLFKCNNGSGKVIRAYTKSEFGKY